MKENFNYLHSDLSVLSNWLSYPFQLMFQLRQKTQQAKHPAMGTETTTLSNKDLTWLTPRQWSIWPLLLTCMDPLTFVPHFPYITWMYFQHFGDSLWDTSQLSSQCGPHWNKFFLVLPPLLSLPLDLVSGKWAEPGLFGTLKPGTLAPLLLIYNHPHCGLLCPMTGVDICLTAVMEECGEASSPCT